MAELNDGSSSSNRKGSELEKFKRRMIRSVARRLKEKKPDNKMWEEMKKEIGSNCKKLWERMRMLTLKKLKRLLEADDMVHRIGAVARMTLTDWLLFDLVIVHEKIDVIDREKLTGSYHSNVLTNLFSLVQRFQIEGRSGESLAEAWTAATVYYNSKGHQCSPMMLQRRWYQIKELTRHKFYKFWFNYRGNQRQLVIAKQDSPDDLQKAIALKYPQIVTHKFLTWEEMIKNRLVILPDELGVKMRQRNLMKASDTTAPDVVLVEPQIEVIDLGATSDNDDVDEPQNATDETQAPLLVKIKSEPVDIDEEVEIKHALPRKKGSEFDEEIERLQMVEENFDKNAFQNNEDSYESVFIDPVPPKETDSEIMENEDCPEDFSDGMITSMNNDQEAMMIDDEGTDHQNDALMVNEDHIDAVMSDDELTVEENSSVKEPADRQLNKTSNIHENTVVDSNVAIAEISSITSAGIKVENMSDVIERSGTLDDQFITEDIPEKLFPVISTVSSAGIKVEKDFAVCSDTFDNTMNVDKAVEKDIIPNDQSDISECLPVITTVSSEGFIFEMKTENLEKNLNKHKSETEETSVENDVISNDVVINESTHSLVVGKSTSSIKLDNFEKFSDIPMDLNFVSEGIDFADDGIAYVEDDDDDIINLPDISLPVKSTKSEELKKGEEDQKNKKEESSEDGAEEKPKAQKFDLKLLMCPVVYTTKVDAMPIFNKNLQFAHVYDKETIDKIYTLSKPVSKLSVTGSEHPFVEQENAENNTTDVKNDQLKNDVINDDDDLFKNEVISESNDFDNDSEIIKDSKRVKMSSYMLQKPKHRNYNPVLLCKNPDFNTRLKKLSVGFFTSARNRMLLQSCIPMTIDMSKAFEDKLINGTLYLKPTPNVSVNTVQDDEAVTSASLVKQSAVQQSLLSIDDALECELKKRMTERNRAINLPDISQVRRLNQHLLTAEVTPLRLENMLQNDVKKSGTVNYVQNIKNDIANMLTQQKAKEFSNAELASDIPKVQLSSPPVSIESPVSRIQPTLPIAPASNYSHCSRVQPTPPIVSLSIDSPISRLKPTPPMVTINSPPRELLLTPPPPQLMSNNTALNKNPTIVSGTDQNSANKSGTTKVRKIPRKPYCPPIAWNKRPQTSNSSSQDQYHSDALLTIDTLYKMLSALDPCNKFNDYNAKKKNKYIKKQLKSKGLDGYSNDSILQKIQDTVIDITDDEVTQENLIQKPKVKTRIRSVDNSCCWCKYKLNCLKYNVKIHRRHRCKSNVCVCCCRELYFNSDYGIGLRCAEKTVENKQEDDEISKTVEHLVKQIKQSVSRNDIGVQIDLNENDVQVEPLLDIPSSSNAVLTQTIEITPSDTSLHNSDEVQAELTALPATTTQQETSKLSVHTGALSKLNVDQTALSMNGFKIKVVPSKKKNNLTNCNRPNSTVKSKPYTLETVNSPNTPCTCSPNISQVSQGRIEINGSNNCLLHKKQMKERRIVLSKKLITDERQPFYVGKNKILLTNLQIPIAKDEQPTDPAPPTPEHGELQSISLPAGVQVLLLPDKTLTYVLQPNVTLTLEEYAILPQFLVAIQEQISAVGVTLPADHPVAKTDEIIDLDSDEAPAKLKNSIVANSVTVPDSTKLTIPILSPKLGDESTSAEISVPKIIEDFEDEIDSIAKEKRTTTDEDFEMRIDILAAEKKNVEKPASVYEKNIQTSAITEPGNSSSNIGKNIENQLPKDTHLIYDQPTTSTNTIEATNKKSLLSDLMEMSGIMEEDLAPPPIVENTPQQPIMIDTSNFVLQRQVPREEVARQRNAISVPSLSPILAKQNTENKSGYIELVAVSSFAELKYARDNKGLFFKLDLGSGQLSSINVCIQKFPSSTQIQDSEKSVIDLTDDPDVSITANQRAKSPKPTEVALNVKPTQDKTQIASILLKKQRLVNRLSNNLKPMNIIQSTKHVAKILKRNKTFLGNRQRCYFSKFKWKTIDDKIDLVDSDTPEEWLKSDDSSDDEPLIKKSKRMHPETTPVSTVPDQTIDEQGEDAPLNEQGPLEKNGQQNTTILHKTSSNQLQEKETMIEQNDEHENCEEYLNINEMDFDEQQSSNQNPNEYEEEHLDEEMEDPTEAAPMPVPTNLVLSGGALNAHSIPINSYRSENDESSQDEDCILGV